MESVEVLFGVSGDKVWSRCGNCVESEEEQFGVWCATYLVNDFVTSFNDLFVFIFFDELDARF